MTEEKYQSYRHQLTVESLELRKRRCYLSAKARIRKIAELDLEHKGIPKEETLQKFNYYNIK